MDAQGSVRMVTDSSGTIVMRAEYDGWGGVLSVTDNVPGGMPYRFVGALGVRWDPETQLLYMRQRWYDSSIQRWISRDPVRAVNRYIYSNNNPSRLEDPMGLTPNSGGSGCVPPGGEGGHVQMGDFGMPNNSTPADILKIFKGYQAIVDAGTPNGICEEYAKLTFNFLRKLKKQGFLKGYHPWIYGWDLPATSNQQMKSAPSINRLGYSTTDYTHNFAVLVEDSTNKVVLVLDPWETGQLMSDSPTVWYSLTTYRRSRVFMNLMYGDIKPWTDAQVRHEAVDYNPYCSK
jgi:RHS repeat-associated protein